MGHRLRFALFVAACVLVVALIQHFALGPGPSPAAHLELTQSRLAAIEAALAAYALDNAAYPVGDDWASTLGLGPEQVADPFSSPPDSEPLIHWSDGRWYALVSRGPDAPALYFHSEYLAHRTESELRALLVSDEIVGDIRFRTVLYDPTNGLRSWGDLVRWGGPAPGSRPE